VYRAKDSTERNLDEGLKRAEAEGQKLKGDVVGGVKDVSSTVGNALHDLKDSAVKTFQHAKDSAESFFEPTKHKMSDGTKVAVDTLHHTAEKIAEPMSQPLLVNPKVVGTEGVPTQSIAHIVVDHSSRPFQEVSEYAGGPTKSLKDVASEQVQKAKEFLAPQIRSSILLRDENADFEWEDTPFWYHKKSSPVPEPWLRP